MLNVKSLLTRDKRADGGKERERRAELAGEMMHAEKRAVCAEFFRSHCQLDRLQQRVARCAHLRLRRRCPVPERQEADLLHPSRRPRTAETMANTTRG